VLISQCGCEDAKPEATDLLGMGAAPPACELCRSASLRDFNLISAKVSCLSK
ncbi:unnamed protein product, partial [Bubo scandiacus]